MRARRAGSGNRTRRRSSTRPSGSPRSHRRGPRSRADAAGPPRGYANNMEAGLLADESQLLAYAGIDASLSQSEGLFREDGWLRRVAREPAVLFGGGCALLLEVAHPLVAAGVAEHSDFRRDPFGR